MKTDNDKFFKKQKGLTEGQRQRFGFVFVLGICAIFVRFLTGQEMLFNSAALYIGLPFLFALGMSLLPKSSSPVGSSFKGLTILILLAFPLLNEGVICIIMASPILYSAGLLTAISYGRYEEKKKGGRMQLAIVATLLAIASTEGVHEITTFPRDNTVEYSSVINAPVEAVREKLSTTPEIKETRPFYMRLFPLPVKTSGAGLEVGDERQLDYIYKKWVWTNEKRGSTVFRVAESSDNYIRFDIPYDKSYLSTYLTWQSSEVFLKSIDADKTEITWRLSYKRKLDPVWYFGPMQHHYVTETAKALIDNVADPNI